MLLKFSASNMLSIWKSQQLSLVASKLDDNRGGLLHAESLGNLEILPSAMIYGANAAGKSNVLNMLGFIRGAVLSSHSKGDPDGGVPRSVFALNESARKTPTHCSIDFIVEGIRYHYGFEADDSRFLSEWLFSFPKGRRQNIFSRKKQSFSFGRGLRGRNQVISELTRDNSLFLSAAAQNDHQQLTPIRNFFQSIRRVAALDVKGEEAAIRIKGENIDSRILEFLGQIGTGVISARRRPHELSSEAKEMRKEILSVIERLSKKSGLQADIAAMEANQIQLGHRNSSGDIVFFDLDDESDGTRRLLIVLHEAFLALDKGRVLVIDELNASLHTKVCEALINLFSSKMTNPHNAQLIATTHDTNILSINSLRRDQVWFVEKDEGGATCLYPLTDISTRKGDNLEKGYIQGRFGAIPCSNMNIVTRDPSR